MMKIKIKPDNEMERNVVSSLTTTNCILYENPQPDNECEGNPIGEMIEGMHPVGKLLEGGKPFGEGCQGGYAWDTTLLFSMVYAPETEDDLPEFLEGRLFQDTEYGYYTRDYTICGGTYRSTFRFNKDKLVDVQRYVLAKSPIELDKYLQTVDGYEWIEQEHR